MPLSEPQMTSVERRILEELTFLADHMLSVEKHLQQILFELRKEKNPAREIYTAVDTQR